MLMGPIELYDGTLGYIGGSGDLRTFDLNFIKLMLLTLRTYLTDEVLQTKFALNMRDGHLLDEFCELSETIMFSACG